MDIRRWLLCGAAVLTAGAVVTGVVVTRPRALAATPDAGAGAGITVTGQAQETATANQATFQVGVSDQAGTAADALNQNNTLAQAVIAALEAKGVPENHLATSDLSVSPDYGDKGEISGFSATDLVTVSVDDASKTGPLIDAALAAGATNVNSISFTPTNAEALQQKALADAFTNAKQRAGAIAAAAGLTLGPATAVTTEAADQTPPPVMFAAAAKAAPTPVLQGQQQVSATVQVTFATTPG